MMSQGKHMLFKSHQIFSDITLEYLTAPLSDDGTDGRFCRKKITR